ncbi:MAG: general secretion pathway protein GspK, partial [Candidatus Solibacter usitatus]|nr:general secretion pathway protein GspK [Candidatus Solibacter usitatus]
KQAVRNPTATPLPRERTGGGALLAVLWVSAGLSAIAFSVASTVRSETERTATALDGVRAYYLAVGAVERAILHMQWREPYYRPGIPLLRMAFPAGDAEVEIIPEAAKFNINSASPEDLYKLLSALGAPPDRAGAITEAIVDWRTPVAESPHDRYYLGLAPSFRPRHASLEEIEELLVVRGMTAELFYGTYETTPEGGLIPRGGLRDCVSVYGSTTRFDVNTAHPAVLLALGIDPQTAAHLVERRRAAPFVAEGEVAGIGAGRLRVGGNSIYTLRATARVRLQNGQLSDLRRSVAALVKFMPPGYDATYHILRWYDNAWRS